MARQKPTRAILRRIATTPAAEHQPDIEHAAVPTTTPTAHKATP
jgi:hypothetical protein